MKTSKNIKYHKVTFKLFITLSIILTETTNTQKNSSLQHFHQSFHLIINGSRRINRIQLMELNI